MPPERERPSEETSMQESDIQDVFIGDLYPNPANTEINISVKNEKNNASVLINSADGKEVLREKSKSTR